MTEQLTEVRETHGDRVLFAVVGPLGAVHFWCEPSTMEDFGRRHYGGVEWHFREQPSWGKPDPDHEDCWLLKGPCWHDGSSLLASETYIPMYEACESYDDYAPLWGMLRNAYKKFEEAETAQ